MYTNTTLIKYNIIIVYLLNLVNCFAFSQKIVEDKDVSFFINTPNFLHTTSDTLIDLELLLKTKNITWNKLKNTYGISNEKHWVKTQLKNPYEHTVNLFLIIDNVHLNKVNFYQFKKDSLTNKQQIGDHTKKQSIYYNKLIFPITLHPYDQYTIYLEIINTGGSMKIPVYLVEKDIFLYEQLNTIPQHIVVISCLCLVLFIGIIAFLFLRKKIVLLYVFYVLTSLLTIATDVGLTYKFLTHEWPKIHEVIRFINFPLLIILFILLSKTIFQSIKKHVFLHRTLKVLILVLVGIILLESFISWYEYSLYIIKKLKYYIEFIAIVTTLYYAFFLLSHKRAIMLPYILAYVPVAFVLLGITLNEVNWVKFPFRTYNQIYIVIVLDVLVLGYVIVNLIKDKFEQVHQLQLAVVKAKKENSNAYIQGMEKEKEQLSLELHDNIGSKLALAQKKLKSNQTAFDLFTDITEILEEVRNISYQLSPNFIHHFSLNELLENILEKSFGHTDIQVNTYFKKSVSIIKLSTTLKLNVYRIVQELSANTLKYAQASLVEVQLIFHQHELTLTFDDDGIGFNTSKIARGIGLQNIYKRVSFLNGQIECISNEKGSSFVIIIPY